MTMRTSLAVGVAALTLACGTPGVAATLDNFNRPDAPTLGAGWTQLNGTSGVAGGQAFGSENALATFAGSTSDTVEFDVTANGTGLQYAGALIGWGSSRAYLIRVQQQFGGGFSHFIFSSGNNPAFFFGFPTALSQAFTSGHIKASVIGNIGTLTITPTGGATQVYQNTFSTAFSGGTPGLGFYGQTRIDNFSDGAAAVPEPATWAMLIAGFGLAGSLLRRRRAALA